MLLEDGTVVQLTDLSFHMSYIKSALSWSALQQLKYISDLHTPFQLRLDERQNPALYDKTHKISSVTFPEKTDFYKQKTASGLPFLGNAVLQGTEWLSFQLLWKCDFACSGNACQYCYSGGELETLVQKGKALPRYPSDEEIAEIVDYAVNCDPGIASIQITGGSTFDERAECDRIVSILKAIDKRVGRNNIQGEILIYTTPPKDPTLLDALFLAGADRISMSLEIWDEALAAKIMPGKMKYTGRKRHLDALEYVAKTYGKNKACSNFIIGLEPADRMLEGAKYLAERGIVPIASVWIPFGRPVEGSMKAPALDYYQTVRQGLSELYCTYGLEPPGGMGLNVCMCRDIWLNR
ncbi:hypothetical protein SDC9_118680 [bioreactor metagenome]|uniref:Radical SAM core domain-containing protein n=1 Tax=bioreactor metagenome TaxID=1076179 RepID=A0A645C1S2_9ZZZZ